MINKNGYELTNKQKGFSLIELLLVLVIIGILAAIGIPSFRKAQAAAQNGTVVGTLRYMSTLEVDFYSKNNRYARLSEINNLVNNSLGTNGTNTLLRGNITYTLSPNPAPTDAQLKSSYTILATKPASDNDPLFSIKVEQDNIITPITP